MDKNSLSAQSFSVEQLLFVRLSVRVVKLMATGLSANDALLKVPRKLRNAANEAHSSDTASFIPNPKP